MASFNGRFLPTDVCREILSWLPAKEVVRCRSVCRSFSVTSRDRSFFVWQSCHAKDDSGAFLRRHDGRFEMVITDACSELPPESLSFLKDGNKRILGSDGGLVLFDRVQNESDGVFYIYNPARRTFRHIPRPKDANILNAMTTGVAFLYSDQDAADENYDIVCMTPTREWDDFMICSLYSSREDAWKLIGDKIFVGPRNIQFHSPVVSSGGIIYLASDCGRYQRQKPYIVAVDIKAGTSTILPLPVDVLMSRGDYEMEIAAHRGGSLSLITYSPVSEFTIWDMKNPKTWVWEQRVQVSMASMGLEPRPVPVFSLINNETLVFTDTENIFVYHLKDRGPLRVIKLGQEGCSYMSSYANTLRPCGRFELDEFNM